MFIIFILLFYSGFYFDLIFEEYNILLTYPFFNEWTSIWRDKLEINKDNYSGLISFQFKLISFIISFLYSFSEYSTDVNYFNISIGHVSQNPHIKAFIKDIKDYIKIWFKFIRNINILINLLSDLFNLIFILIKFPKFFIRLLCN